MADNYLEKKYEEYLKKNVKDILQPLLKKILDERPSEPVTNKNKLIFF